MRQPLITAITFFCLLDCCYCQEGARRVKLMNYDDCIELFNKETTVTLGHHVGGRVLKYAHRGQNALYLNPNEAKWGTPDAPRRPPSSAGRFDIGPELLVPRRDVLWSGKWSAEITGPRAARLTSQPDRATGVQLIREFELAGRHVAPTVHANHQERLEASPALESLEPNVCHPWRHRDCAFDTRTLPSFLRAG